MRKRNKQLWGFGLLAILLTLLSGGCSTNKTYTGTVLRSDSEEPIADLEVCGSWMERGRFAPSIDGVFTRKNKSTRTTTDKEGHFRIDLAGFNRQIAVFDYRYKQFHLYLDDWPASKSIVVKLDPRQTE